MQKFRLLVVSILFPFSLLNCSQELSRDLLIEAQSTVQPLKISYQAYFNRNDGFRISKTPKVPLTTGDQNQLGFFQSQQDPVFEISNPFTQFYPYHDSLDFDLGFQFLSGTQSYSCVTNLNDFDPPTAFLSNADGYLPNNTPFIDYRKYSLNLLRETKVRRFEVDVAGAPAVSFDIEFLCEPTVVHPAEPIITTVIPLHGSLDDSIVINGIHFLNWPFISHFPHGFILKTIVTIDGKVAPIASRTNSQIVVNVPLTADTGPLVVKKVFVPVSLSEAPKQKAFAPPAFLNVSYSDTVGHFRVTGILEQHFEDIGEGSTTGVLVTNLFPVGSINPVTGCPTVAPIYQLYKGNFDISSGVAVSQSERVPDGTFDVLSWIDINNNFSPLPQAGDRRVSNLSQTVNLLPLERQVINQEFLDTYPQACSL